MKELNLGSYEVVLVEFFYDFKEYINNILKELLKYFNDIELILFEEVLEVVFFIKEKFRGLDYCLCCVVLVFYFGNNCCLSIKRFFNIFVEFCELLYVFVEKCILRFILCLYNVVFSYVIVVCKVI